MSEPKWLTVEQVVAIHEEQVAEFGGLAGIRDEGALHSALDRPRNKWVYEEARDFPRLAAAYGFGLARTHPFVDGNKRTGLIAMYTFLGRNGFRLVADEEEAVLTMIGVAAGDISEMQLAAWLRANTKRRARPR